MLWRKTAGRTKQIAQSLSLFSAAQILARSHGRADVTLLLMVIRLVAHSDPLLLHIPPQFAVCVLAVGAVLGPSVILEDASHLMDQIVDCQDGGG